MTSAIVVADTSVLLNFLKIGRMDLIGSHPRRFLATDHVENEITDETQRAAFLAAVASGHLDTCTVNDRREVELFLRLAPGVRLGAGECSALAVAVNRGHAIAIDDNRALNRAFRDAGLGSVRIEIIRTPDVMIALIRSGVLTVEKADRIKDEWAREHRFRINAATFADLL
jgi:predicted nucleic acid-binding protein